MLVHNAWSKLKLPFFVGVLVISVIFFRQIGISTSSKIVAGKNSFVTVSIGFVPFYKGKKWLFYSDPVFSPLEKLAIDTDGHPVVNASFKRALKQSTAKLPVSLSQEQLQRLTFLTERQFPGRKGQVLAAWLVNYHQYREAKVSLLKNAKTDNEPLTAYRALMNLRETYFGKAQAKLLFEHQYRFADNLAKIEGQ